MPNLERLREFAAIVDAGSISEAARILDLPRTSLSRRLSALENDLGVRLMHRQTRRLVLTPAGDELYHRARRIVVEANEAWTSVRLLDGVPRGVLRVSVPDNEMSKADLFVQFAEEFPAVQLEVSVTPRFVDLVTEGIDVAIRFGHVSNQSLIVRRLWSFHFSLFAAPSYIERRGIPNSANDLVGHDCILGFGGGHVPERAWPLLHGGAQPISARFASSGLELRIAAAERGLGVALLPRSKLAKQLADGTLVLVLEDVVGSEAPMNLVFVDRELMPPQMRLFIDRATDYFLRWGADVKLNSTD